MPHHVKVVPVRLRERSDALDCETVRIVAYRYVCSCGALGSSRASYRRARREGMAHRHEPR